MKISIVIVSYNVKCYLHQCLLSLQRALTGIDSEVFVVDNHSHDGTSAFVREAFPWVKFIENQQNLGFSKANNMAIAQAAGQYILLLNPDTIVGENVIRDALAYCDHCPDVGAVGVRMLTDTGTSAMESRRGLPTPLTAFYKFCGLCARFPRSSTFGHYYMSALPWEAAADIDVVSGAFFLVPAAVLQCVGTLDEHFFMYGEDIDLSYRILKHGKKNVYLPLQILHYKGESTQKTSFRYVHVFYLAMLTFFRKHYRGASLLLPVAVYVGIALKTWTAMLHVVWKKMWGRGIWGESDRCKALYLFIGEEVSSARFSQLALTHGLDHRITIGNEDTLPQGHLADLGNLPDTNVYMVYDTTAYSYQAIFKNFVGYPLPQVKIGMFYPNEHMIVTTEDIIQ